MKKQKKDNHLHIVKIPKVLSHCRKDQICLVIYHLSKNLFDLELLKQKAKEDQYLDLCQIRVILDQKMEDVLQFICKEENLTVKEVIIYSLIAEENNPMFFEIKK